jgi:hypothetical protein
MDHDHETDATGGAAPALSPEQLVTVIRMLGEVDSVELKLSVPETQRRSAVAALRMDPLDAQIRQVTFFDTPDLRLDRAGVVVRARRVQRKAGDAVVKLRPVDPEQLDPKLRILPAFGVEIDALPGGFVCSARMKVSVDDAVVRAVMDGSRPLRKLLNKKQRAFYEAHAPSDVALDDLAILGPITVVKLKFAPPDFGRRLVAELWNYPDGSRVLELSTRCLPTEAFQAAAELKAYLTERGIDLGAPQETKTRAALDFFAGELTAQLEGRSS